MALPSAQMDQIYLYALSLLRRRDYTAASLCRKIESTFGCRADEVVETLIRKNYLNDRRFAENYIRKKKDRGPAALREELIARGVSTEICDEVLRAVGWPSLHQALAAKMNAWKLRPPLQAHDSARLFRALLRLGYDEDAIREEIDNLHEQ
jgi:SOS response regulatory protein OraA/RecX